LLLSFDDENGNINMQLISLMIDNAFGIE